MSHPELRFIKNMCVCVCVGLSTWMALCYPSPIWLSHSGCTRLGLVCTLTPTEVWSASWSKRKRQNRHTHTHTFSWQATARSYTHAVDKPSPGSRVGSLGGISESAGIHLWQVTQFTEVFSPFTHPSVHPTFGGAASGVCGIFNFVTLSWSRGAAGCFVTRGLLFRLLILWREILQIQDFLESSN